jgi:hypothetical protein
MKLLPTLIPVTFSEKSRNMLIIMIITMPLFVLENLEGYLATSIISFSTSPSGLSIYVLIFAGYIVLQFCGINFINENSKLLKSKSRIIDRLKNVVFITQYVLAFNLILILAQIFILGEYSLASLYFPTIVSLSLVCILFFTFGFQFLKWRRNIRQSIGILLFAFSFLLLGVVQFIDLPYLYLNMLQLPNQITPTTAITPPIDLKDKFLIFLIDNSVYVDYGAFALMMFGTALLLWQYSRKLNKIVLGVLIAIPLAGYAGSDIEAFHIQQLQPYLEGDGFLVFLSLAGIFSWLSHSFAFFYVARKVPQSSIKIFLNMTAIGFIFFSLSYTVDVSMGSYPPYMANSFALFPISVFMILFGVYGSALSLSQDITLRKRVKPLARGNESLLSNIGSAEIENKLTGIVVDLKNIVDEEESKLKEESGLETPMEKDEIKTYLEEVITEVKKKKGK